MCRVLEVIRPHSGHGAPTHRLSADISRRQPELSRRQPQTNAPGTAPGRGSEQRGDESACGARGALRPNYLHPLQSQPPPHHLSLPLTISAPTHHLQPAPPTTGGFARHLRLAVTRERQLATPRRQPETLPAIAGNPPAPAGNRCSGRQPGGGWECAEQVREGAERPEHLRSARGADHIHLSPHPAHATHPPSSHPRAAALNSPAAAGNSPGASRKLPASAGNGCFGRQPGGGWECAEQVREGAPRPEHLRSVRGRTSEVPGVV
ncbi:hypothetical protein FB475_4597 [Kribbella jejuensis]|uniref:Uncharacterized protein n=1 Tax=Kribbella jejuensis TaxID=236068 RepID=A0A542E8T6_9ACTN|nr:hypothetical protein FB475_4597 [Kribbella jejuensis]